jgi:hypothetical protein
VCGIGEASFSFLTLHREELIFYIIRRSILLRELLSLFITLIPALTINPSTIHHHQQQLFLIKLASPCSLRKQLYSS